MYIPGLKIGRKYPWDITPGGYHWSSPTPERWQPGNEHNQCVGADLDSALLALSPTHRIHYVIGTGAVVTVNLPWVGFSGEVIFIPEGAFTWTAAGNIAVAGTAVAGRPVHMTYHPAKGKWYTHAIA